MVKNIIQKLTEFFFCLSEYLLINFKRTMKKGRQLHINTFLQQYQQ